MQTRTRPLLAALCGTAGLSLLVAPGLFVSVAAERSLSAAELALSALCTSTALGLVALCGALLVRRPVGDTLALARGQLSAKSVTALVIGTAGISHLLDWTTRSLGIREQGALEIIEGALAGASGWTLLLCLVGVAIAPGIGEELLFRGLLMRSLARRAGVAAGIITSAVLFGAVHADLTQGCAAAVLGLYLGAAAIASGSTRTSTACHVANNLAAVLAAAWGSHDASPVWESTLLMLAGGGAIVGLVTLWGTFPAAAGAFARVGRAAGTSGPDPPC